MHEPVKHMIGPDRAITSGEKKERRNGPTLAASSLLWPDSAEACVQAPWN